MNDIFSKDLNGEMVSPDEPGYDALIDDIFRTMETAQELATVSIRDQKRVHELMGKILESDIETGFCHFFLAGFYQLVSGLQSTFDNPFLRCQFADFGKISFECRQTAARIICYFLHR